MDDRETIIEIGDGGAGAVVAGLLAVVVLVVGLFFYFGAFHRSTTTIDVSAPRAMVDVTPARQ